MTDTLVTPRFSLPLLATAQAQKELTHNEALLLIDALLHGTVEGGPVSDPPPAPAAGQCWLVGASPTGEWAGQARRSRCGPRAAGDLSCRARECSRFARPMMYGCDSMAKHG